MDWHQIGGIGKLTQFSILCQSMCFIHRWKDLYLLLNFWCICAFLQSWVSTNTKRVSTDTSVMSTDTSVISTETLFKSAVSRWYFQFQFLCCSKQLQKLQYAPKRIWTCKRTWTQITISVLRLLVIIDSYEEGCNRQNLILSVMNHLTVNHWFLSPRHDCLGQTSLMWLSKGWSWYLLFNFSLRYPSLTFPSSLPWLRRISPSNEVTSLSNHTHSGCHRPYQDFTYTSFTHCSSV